MVDTSKDNSPSTPVQPNNTQATVDLDDFAPRKTIRHANLAEESSISFMDDTETSDSTHAHNAGVVSISPEHDPIPNGPIGWIMRYARIKKIKKARTVGIIFICTLCIAVLAILIREYLISFTSIPVPTTTPLVRELPIIE